LEEEKKESTTQIISFTSKAKQKQDDYESYHTEPKRNYSIKQGWDAFRKKSQEVSPPYRKLVRNTFICALIALSVWGIKSIDSGVTNTVSGGIEDAITDEFQIDQDLGRLKFVVNDSTVEVSGDTEVDYTVPMEGEVVETFAQTGRAITIKGEQNALVNAILPCTVLEAGDDFVYVANDNGTQTEYSGLTPCVQAGDKLQDADAVGELLGDELTLETSSGSEYIDPLSAGDVTATSR